MFRSDRRTLEVRRPFRCTRALLLVGVIHIVSGLRHDIIADQKGGVNFDTEIQPIFDRACLKCHGPEKQRGGLRLDVGDSMRAGGDSGEPAVVPGKVDESPILARVSSNDVEQRMPPMGERLSVAEIELLRKWISEGAAWPVEKNHARNTERAEMVVTEADREHWSFRPLRPIQTPRGQEGVSNTISIDALLNAARSPRDLIPTPEADRTTLIRRLSFDLIGLPPRFEDVETFVKDTRPDAYERIVDRLLASPHDGERWGRHWLDLARYADSDGYENDLDRKNAYHYRDFVIRALNDDMPFDQFVRWQIAGDEFEPSNPRAVAATGFCASAPSQETTPSDTLENKAKIRYDELDNMLATTGSALLGLTIGCARCHDHKFDPIPTRDYYRMLSAFNTSRREDAPLSKARRDLDCWLREQRRLHREAKMQELRLSDDEKFWLRQPEHFFVPVQIELYKKYGKTLEVMDEALAAWLKPEQRRFWETLKARVVSEKADDRRVVAILDESSVARESFLLGRGSVSNRKEAVQLGFLQVLTRSANPAEFVAKARSRIESTNERDVPVLGTTYQRAALAEWLTDVDRGAGALLARVAVNRVWQHHFGEGLSRTPDDFGTAGENPAVPELLDWLAADLIQGGWRLKPLHRRILLSETYRQATNHDSAKAAIDLENRLLWRRHPIRLESEAIRDAMLAAAGRLSEEVFGPPFRPPIPAEAIATRSKDAYPKGLNDGPETWRRSIYAFTKRSVPNPMAEVFDAPESTATCGRRNTTAIPTQNLLLLNDPFVRARARDFAERVAKESGDDIKRRIERAYQIALSRSPLDWEMQSARAFLKEDAGKESLIDFCHVLFTLNEFLYVD